MKGIFCITIEVMCSVENSFGFKFLSSIDGIEKETINNLMSKGYHSLQSLLSVKFDVDLYPMLDILSAQKHSSGSD